MSYVPSPAPESGELYQYIQDEFIRLAQALGLHTGDGTPTSPATGTSWNAHGNTATGTATTPLKVEDATFFVKGGVSDPGDAPAEFSGATAGMAYVPSKEAFRGGSVQGTQWATLGPQSFAFGNSSQATAIGSMAIGNLSSATQVGAVALGAVNTASGLNAVAAGSQTTASASGSVGIGISCTASGSSSVSVGDGVVGLSPRTLGLGNSILLFGDESAGIGNYIQVTAAGAFVVGSGIDAANRLSNAVADSLMIGIGTTTPTFTLRSGKVGVGSTATNPLSTFDVIGSVGYQSKTIDSGDSPYTLSDELVLLVDTSGGNVTVNLPQISGVNRRMYHIKCIEYGSGAGTNDVIIRPFSGDYIDQNDPATAPSATDIVIDRGDSVQLVADTTPANDTWWII